MSVFAGVTRTPPAVVLTSDASGTWDRGDIHLCRGVVSVSVAIVVGERAHHCCQWLLPALCGETGLEGEGSAVSL